MLIRYWMLAIHIFTLLAAGPVTNGSGSLSFRKHLRWSNNVFKEFIEIRGTIFFWSILNISSLKFRILNRTFHILQPNTIFHGIALHPQCEECFVLSTIRPHKNSGTSDEAQDRNWSKFSFSILDRLKKFPAFL